ncbi:MAG: hypothetical protein FWE31_02315 [Firmicutes bacterium]|nr:hypothetical protein [Bacillota bacterium]
MRKELSAIQKNDKKDFQGGDLNSNLYDEQGRKIIVVHIDGDPSLAYKNYSNRYNMKISPELYEHITAENCHKAEAVQIRVFNDVLVKNDTRRNLLKASMQNTFSANRRELLDEIKACWLLGILYWLIGIAIVMVAVFIPQFGPFSDGANELLLIVAWVFVWAGTERILIERIGLRKQYRSVLNLALAEIVFVPLPPPLLPKNQ